MSEDARTDKVIVTDALIGTFDILGATAIYAIEEKHNVEAITMFLVESISHAIDAPKDELMRLVKESIINDDYIKELIKRTSSYVYAGDNGDRPLKTLVFRLFSGLEFLPQSPGGRREREWRGLLRHGRRETRLGSAPHRPRDAGSVGAECLTPRANFRNWREVSDTLRQLSALVSRRRRRSR